MANEYCDLRLFRQVILIRSDIILSLSTPVLDKKPTHLCTYSYVRYLRLPVLAQFFFKKALNRWLDSKEYIMATT